MLSRPPLLPVDYHKTILAVPEVSDSSPQEAQKTPRTSRPIVPRSDRVLRTACGERQSRRSSPGGFLPPDRSDAHFRRSDENAAFFFIVSIAFSNDGNDGNVRHLPAQHRARWIPPICRSKGSYLLFQNRLIRARQTLTRRQHPRQSSNKAKAGCDLLSTRTLTIEQLLLQPRSALGRRCSLTYEKGGPRIGPRPTLLVAHTSGVFLQEDENPRSRRRHAIGSLLQRHPFSEPLTWTGGLLHIP